MQMKVQVQALKQEQHECYKEVSAILNILESVIAYAIIKSCFTLKGK